MMTTDTTTDPEAARLVDAYGQAMWDFARAETEAGRRKAWEREREAAAALLAYFTANYVRRDRINGVFSVDGPVEEPTDAHDR